MQNLCALKGSSAAAEDGTEVCRNIAPEQINLLAPIQEMLISDTEVETRLPPIKFVANRQRSKVSTGNVYSFLDLRAAVFNLNGTFEGWKNADDGFLQLCGNKHRFPDAWLGFGVNYKVNCQLTGLDIVKTYPTKYYQLCKFAFKLFEINSIHIFNRPCLP